MATDRNRESAASRPTENMTAAGAAGMPRIRWDDSNMQSSYANVANVASTREEVVLLFGINQAWHAGQKEVAIQLTNRIILSPFAAKRLHTLLGNVISEYESRFGQISVEGR
ncbi:MAG: DUF3467 domain-containing protein [Nitrospira sp.]|nr:DUF3467 domain-containing protein [Nitrospira sp.]